MLPTVRAPLMAIEHGCENLKLRAPPMANTMFDDATRLLGRTYIIYYKSCNL